MDDQRDYEDERDTRDETIREGLDEAGYGMMTVEARDLRPGDVFYSREVGYVEVVKPMRTEYDSIAVELCATDKRARPMGQQFFGRTDLVDVNRPAPSVSS